MAQQERRAATNQRFEELEGDVSWLKSGYGGLKRKLDEVTKCQTYVVEGAMKLEELYNEKCGENVAPKKWRELKEGWGGALLQDLATQLNINWPLPAGPDDEVTCALNDLHVALRAEGVVKNIHPS